MGAGNESSPRAFVEFGEDPIGQRLKGPADAVLTGQRQCQPGGKQGAENQRGGHGEEISMEEGGTCESVPAGEFSHVDGHPRVVGEVEKLDLAEESSRDRRGCESPRIWIAAEFEAGDEQPDADAGFGAGDHRKLLKVVRCACSRHRDPDQATLGLGRLDLALHAGNRDLRGGRLPVFLGAEPSDGFLVRLDLGCRGFDGTGVDDREEFRACSEVENASGWIGAGRRLVGAGNGDQMNMDLHGVVPRARTVSAAEGLGRSRERCQRLREGERGRLMAIFALTEYAGFC